MESSPIVPFTSEIFARRYLDAMPDLTLVVWAENMVMAGFDSDNLSILLGEIAPFNKFEIDNILDRIQSELKIPQINSRSEAIEIVATARIHRFIRGLTSSASAMSELASLYTHDDETESICDFYLLHYAAIDLKIGEYQYYWPDANRKNIEKVIKARCVRWLEDHPLVAWRKYEWQIRNQKFR